MTLSKLLTYPKPQRVHLVNERTGCGLQSGFAQHLAIVNLVVIVIIMSTKTHISLSVTLRERHIMLQSPSGVSKNIIWKSPVVLHFSSSTFFLRRGIHLSICPHYLLCTYKTEVPKTASVIFKVACLCRSWGLQRVGACGVRGTDLRDAPGAKTGWGWSGRESWMPQVSCNPLVNLQDGSSWQEGTATWPQRSL